ncbi:MAG: amidohydrolase [Spirochaetaceae bacterium]|jgi:aminobenzoyl-glutamate utilization protein B|nr:amidohydrolase [Spirochaetaceae bacterium]
MNENIQAWFDQNSGKVIELSDAIWAKPEVALKEQFACTETAAFLKAQGFDVKTFDVLTGKPSSEPNCIVAKWGAGPAVGFLGEYDALAGLGQGQKNCPACAPKDGPGHGCGHNLICGTSVGAAASLKAALEKEKIPGTVIFYGCPAEETLAGKVWMAKHGLFEGLDIAFAWHAAPFALTVMEASMQASTNIFFSFHGKTAHAAANPDQGRSALDAAELMNVGVQYLREHIPDDSRIHYCYTHAGEAPNIVPDFAELNYYIRARTRKIDDELVTRVVDIAKGAALMTGTTMDYRVNSGCYETFVCHSLNRLCRESALKVPEIVWDDADRNFAAALYKAAAGKDAEGELLCSGIPPLAGKVSSMTGSSDVADVSHIVPTGIIFGLGILKGLPFHHWSVVSTAGSDIGRKTEVYAGKVLAQCAFDLLKAPDSIKAVQKAFRESRKDMAPYKPVM